MSETISTYQLSGAYKQGARSVLAVAHYPGEAEALAPVLQLVQQDLTVHLAAVAAGKAAKYWSSLPDFAATMVPANNADDAAAVFSQQPAILVSGYASHAWLHTQVRQRWPNVPWVLLDDYYGTAAAGLRRFGCDGLVLPTEVLTLDNFAADNLRRQFPDLNGHIFATGQPALDYLADTTHLQELRQEARQQLGLDNASRLVACFAAVGGLALATTLFGRPDRPIQNSATHFAIRKHPRDTTDAALFEKLVIDAGLPLIQPSELSSFKLVAAADLIAVLPSSTLSLHALMQDTPAVSIVDRGANACEDPAPWTPATELGAMPNLTAAGFWRQLPALLDPGSPIRQRIAAATNRLYPPDHRGGSAERIAAHILNQL